MRIRTFGLTSLAAAAFFASALAPTPAHAQLWTWTKDQMVEYTKGWTGERFADGRPKVPDAWLARAKDMSMEEVIVNWGRGGGGFGGGAGRGAAGAGRGGAGAGAPGGGRAGAGAPAGRGAAGAGRSAGGFGGGGVQGYGEYVSDFQITHPDKHMAGRAFTLLFMPTRPDLDAIVDSKTQGQAAQTTSIQRALDMLQPGDVVVVDLYGKKVAPTVVPEDLLYYIGKATKNGGLVVDGSFGNLDSLLNMEMPTYYRTAAPDILTADTATLAGVNVPIRVGGVTVMPGDLVLGDREGVSFIPAELAEGVLDSADSTHIHDEWTKMKFDTGKYKSTDIYSQPRTPELRQEYNEYLRKRLDEIHAQEQKDQK